MHEDGRVVSDSFGVEAGSTDPVSHRCSWKPDDCCGRAVPEAVRSGEENCGDRFDAVRASRVGACLDEYMGVVAGPATRSAWPVTAGGLGT